MVRALDPFTDGVPGPLASVANEVQVFVLDGVSDDAVLGSARMLESGAWHTLTCLRYVELRYLAGPSRLGSAA